MMVAEETRKGPWTEEEDMQLVCFVGLFGERRWDFIAKVSGSRCGGVQTYKHRPLLFVFIFLFLHHVIHLYRLPSLLFKDCIFRQYFAPSSLLAGLHRTGKSCRLRWVNYLHPGLKRGRMSPQEERLILELHSRWGNRWSRIARKLPGRTDNEIKNYWRTHMRKKAQERKRNASASSSSSASAASSLAEANSTPAMPSPADTCPQSSSVETPSTAVDASDDGAYPMEWIWDEIAPPSEYAGGGAPLAGSRSLWDYCADPLTWGEEEGLGWDPQPCWNNSIAATKSFS